MEPTNSSEKKFYEDLEIKVNLVQLHEDVNLLNYALEMIPFEELNNKVSEKQILLEKNSVKMGSDDLLILELLHWFKCSFFSWMDQPKCPSCNETAVARGMIPPTSSELDWGANRVEHYFCTPCQQSIRFPRYNHPRKLLKTRKGRCGEWATCFMLFCRSLGYEARQVWDWKDHVWTEVFSQSQSRWLHCDPCESLCDQPLIYEIGWKKEISYAVAFSKDEVQDVTWRYTHKFLDVLSRRKLCNESWLTTTILSFSNTLQSTLSSERKKELQTRRVLELVEFLTPPKLTSGHLGGRQSGSLAWRLARGEISSEGENCAFVFNLTENDIDNRQFHIKYNCASDKYIHASYKSGETPKWQSFTFEHSNIFRKTETDWKTVYIARTEGSPKGFISWKFDFKTSGLVIKTLKLNTSCKTFENGVIRWFLSSSREGNAKEYPHEDVASLTTEDFNGSSDLVITAQLSGGIGSVAWQHAQLFRQPMGSQECPFEVQIYLDKE